MVLRTKVLIAGLSGVALWGCTAFARTPHPSPSIRIVVPESPAPPEQFAAQELVKYLTTMGNPKPTIVRSPLSGEIYVNTVPQDMPQSEKETIESGLRGEDGDSFMLRSSGTRLIIRGNSPRAGLYGAYHYLETLGARWYFPGKENEVIPRTAVKLEGYDITEIPSFHKRGIVVFSTTPGFDELVDFAAKVKLNTIGLHAIPYPWGPKDPDMGLANAAVSTAPRGLTLDIERHFFGETLCPDDSMALARAKADFTSYVKTLPADMKEFFLWAADKNLSLCSSAQYRDYSVSDLILWFDVQILETLRLSRPEAKFAFLSYLSTWEPPQHEKPVPGLILEWAPMNQSYAHAFDDPGSATNTEYRNDFETLIQMFGAKNSQVLGYWLDDSLFSRTYFSKLPYVPQALKGDLAYYHRKGVPAVTTFGVVTGRDYFASHASPVVFLYPQLLWNVQGDPREMMRDFCRLYFGSEQAIEIFDLLSQADRMVYVERHQLQAQKVGDPKFVETVSKALELAQKLLGSQRTPTGKARAARLVQEVSSRYVSPSPGGPG